MSGRTCAVRHVPFAKRCEFWRTGILPLRLFAVLAVWLTSPEVPPPSQEAWVAQRSEIFQTVREGAWWGTITSEPGSGGDMAKTKATARPAGSDGPLSDHRPEAVGERFRDNLLL